MALDGEDEPLLPGPGASSATGAVGVGDYSTFGPSRSSSRRPSRSARPSLPPILKYPAGVAAVVFLAVLAVVAGGYTLGGGGAGAPIWQRNLGAYAPLVAQWTPPLPAECEVEQAIVLHRHTARYPTAGHGERLRETLAKLANATVPPRHPEAAFLRTADVTMEGWKFGQLTDAGRHEAWRSGRAVHARYPRLAKSVFTRSASGDRVLESARLFLQGLKGEVYDPLAWPNVDVVLPEGESSNNTLCVHNCEAQRASEGGAAERDLALALLSPAAERLSALLALDLVPEDIMNVAAMCGFETAISGQWSPWCHLLRRHEWEAAGYVADVERWYAFAGGSAYGRTMGAGWVNELLARLTDTYPTDRTCTNRTLDADPASFPPGGKRLFIDFTHDNEMIAILTALGTTHRDMPPAPRSVPRRTWILAHLTPFGARWSFERVVCTPENDRRDKYLRFLVKWVSSPRKKPDDSDRVQRIEHPECRDTLCPLDAFVASQRWAREDVDWGVCVLPPA